MKKRSEIMSLANLAVKHPDIAGIGLIAMADDNGRRAAAMYLADKYLNIKLWGIA